MIWSNLHFLSQTNTFSEKDLSFILENRIKMYRKLLSFKFPNTNFGNNFFEVFSKKDSIFDLFYDINNEKWVLTSEIKGSLNKIISKELSSKTLAAQEIIRLNPKAIQLDEIQTQIDNEKDSYTFLPHHFLFVETKHSKISRYFLEFLISYERNFLLFSSAQNGKTTVVQEIIRGKIEKNELKNVKISFDRDVSVPQFQNTVERHYIKKSLNFYCPNSNNKCMIFVDDLHLGKSLEERPNSLGCLRGLIENRGWFSAKLNKFIVLSETFTGSAFSLSQREQNQLFWDIGQIDLFMRFFYDFC